MAVIGNYKTLTISEEGRKGGSRRSENQDRVLSRIWESVPGVEGPVRLIAVADGISLCSYGGSVARFLIETHLAKTPLLLNDGLPLHERFLADFAKVGEIFKQEYADMPDMLSSGCTFSGALLHGDLADCFWVGDSPIVVCRKGGVAYTAEQISVPDARGHVLTDRFNGSESFQLKHKQVELAIGDVVVVMTDGVPHPANGIAQELSDHGVTQNFMKSIVDRATCRPCYDDVSLAVAERVS